MILAAVRYAEDPERHRPPDELELLWQCRQMHALPYPGGILDQPAGLIRRMLSIDNAYATWRSFSQSAHKPQWADDHPDGWRLVQQIWRLRAQTKHD